MSRIEGGLAPGPVDVNSKEFVGVWDMLAVIVVMAMQSIWPATFMK
jgi:hypothetical protein